MRKKNKKSDVPRALERAGVPCLAFANTGVPRRDDRRKGSQAPPSMPLVHYGELVTWSQRMGVLSGAAVVRIFTALALDKELRPEDLATMSGHLNLRRAVPAGGGFRWEWTGSDDALDRPLWAVAQSAADLLVSGERAFVRQCGGSGCRQLFISRSRQRFWCDMNTCGNRAKGRRQRRFQRYAKEGVLRRKPTSSSSSEGASGPAEFEEPTSSGASDRLVDLQPTELYSPERLVVSQPTVLDRPERLDADFTTEREPAEGLAAVQPNVREP